MRSAAGAVGMAKMATATISIISRISIDQKLPSFGNISADTDIVNIASMAAMVYIKLVVVSETIVVRKFEFTYSGRTKCSVKKADMVYVAARSAS